MCYLQLQIVLEEALYEIGMETEKKMVTLNQKYDCNLRMKAENLCCASSSPTEGYPCSWSKVKHVHVLLNCGPVLTFSFRFCAGLDRAGSACEINCI